jgi:hypothetical protein
MYNATFETGWEYNRMIGDDPLMSRNSALPADLLRKGGAQFFLFKHVYCTKESLTFEKEAAERLGWASSSIFDEFEREGLIQAIDLQDLPFTVKNRIKHEYDDLRNEGLHGDVIRSYLTDKDKRGVELELVKLRLLKPVMEHLKCIPSVSPSSLENWPSTSSTHNIPIQDEVGTDENAKKIPTPDAIARVEQFVTALLSHVESIEEPSGILLCPYILRINAL